VRLLLERDLRRGVANGERAEDEPGERNQRASDPDDGARRIACGERAGRKGGQRDAEIARGFVQAEREAAPLRSCQVDLHDDGHRPGKALIRAEQDVRGHDEPPRWGESDQDGDGERDQPAEDKQALATDPFGELTCREVRERLGRAEGDDEGEDRRA
jgi:hypothetical protein